MNIHYNVVYTYCCVLHFLYSRIFLIITMIISCADGVFMVKQSSHVWFGLEVTEMPIARPMLNKQIQNNRYKEKH